MAFGLLSVKVLALTCTSFLMVFGVALTIRASTFQNTWLVNASELGNIFQAGADFGFIFGLIVVIVTIFGFMAIFLNGYGMLVVYAVLLACLCIAMVAYGIILWIEVKNDSGRIVLKLKTIIYAIKMEQLDKIQRNFQCCGVEKYTDYLMLWKLWEKSYRPDGRSNATAITKPPVTGEDSTLAPRPSTTPKRGWFGKKKSWKEVPFAVEVEDEEEEEDTTEYIPPNQPKRIWKAPKATERSKPSRKISDNLNRVDLLHREIWDTLQGPLKFYKSRKDMRAMRGLGWLVPSIVKRWLNAIVYYIRAVFDWFMTPVHYLYRWWFGSGWDRIFFQSLQPSLHGNVLPYSCCKNPSKRCSGELSETWNVGCREALMWYYKASNMELAILFLCFFLTTFVTIIVVYIFIGGIREKYYF